MHTSTVVPSLAHLNPLPLIPPPIVPALYQLPSTVLYQSYTSLIPVLQYRKKSMQIWLKIRILNEQGLIYLETS